MVICEFVHEKLLVFVVRGGGATIYNCEHNEARRSAPLLFRLAMFATPMFPTKGVRL